MNMYDMVDFCYATDESIRLPLKSWGQREKKSLVICSFDRVITH